MGYRLKYDWHTHTVFSHGRGTIEENVLEARAKGLESIAITDHGPGHFGYGFRRRDISKMRAEIDELNRKYDDIEIYMSVEANIINKSGDLDVRPEEFELYDFVIAGYHFGTLGEHKADSIRLHAKNLLASKTGKYSDALTAENTELVVNALSSNKIMTLTHPGDKGRVDLDAVFKACEETGTYLEISNRHRQLTVEEIRMAAKYDVKFIIGSDAHVPQRVGTCENAVRRIIEAGIDEERIVNLIHDI
jgi:putative hydrolase